MREASKFNKDIWPELYEIYKWCKNKNVNFVLLFGSFITKKQNQGDIDVVIVSKIFENTSYLIRKKRYKVPIGNKIHIDAICLTPSEAKSVLNYKTEFRRCIGENYLILINNV